MSAFDTMKEPATSRQSLASEAEVGSTNGQDKDTPHVKKRHRRMKSSGVKKDGDEGTLCMTFDLQSTFLLNVRPGDDVLIP